MPFSQPIYDAWHEDEEPIGEIDTAIALIEENPRSNMPEMGFCHRIDMSYKGKSDQWSDFFFKWYGDQKEFEKICQDLQIDIIYEYGETDEI